MAAAGLTDVECATAVLGIAANLATGAVVALFSASAALSYSEHLCNLRKNTVKSSNCLCSPRKSVAQVRRCAYELKRGVTTLKKP
jgi:hypothetical protein